MTCGHPPWGRLGARRSARAGPGSFLVLISGSIRRRQGGRLGRIGDVVGLDLPALVRRRDDQPEVLETGQALDHRRARQPSPLGQLAQADGHAPVRHPAARFEHHQIDLDGFAPDPGQVAPVEEDTLDPVGLDGHGDGHGYPPSLVSPARPSSIATRRIRATPPPRLPRAFVASIRPKRAGRSTWGTFAVLVYRRSTRPDSNEFHATPLRACSMGPRNLENFSRWAVDYGGFPDI